MKSVCILLLIFGLAAAKPFEEFEEDENMDDALEKSLNDYGTMPPPTDNYYPTGPDYKTPYPTGDYKSTGPQPSGGPSPTGKPNDFWKKFAHFLFVKSVNGVKPDEHPDLKYKVPGEALISKLVDIKKEVVQAFGPLMEIGKLMKEDHIEMMRRVHEAVSNNDIAKAQHVVGEYFIAIQRRMAMFVVEASQRGLFDKVGDDKDDGIDSMLKRGLESAQQLDDGAKYILKNFNQFRVSDGLMDEPFVKLGVQTAKVMHIAGMQMKKVFMTGTHVYIDLISRMVWLSIEKHNHDAAVHMAGASCLSFIRRGTKVSIALHRIYSKKCYAKGDSD